MGVPEEASKPLGPQALPKAIAILCFCCMGAELRFRYTRSEFAADFPELADSVLKREFYLDYYPEFDGTTAGLRRSWWTSAATARCSSRNAVFASGRASSPPV